MKIENEGAAEILTAVDLVSLNPEKRSPLIPVKDWSKRSRFIIESGLYQDARSMGYFGHRNYLMTVVKPVNRCNADCLYCSTYKKDDYRKMTQKILDLMYDRIFDYAEKTNLKLLSFQWHGGEPSLMGKDFFTHAWETTRNRRDFHFIHRIQTNLMEINEKWIELFKKYDVEVGTSVDPLIPHIRNYQNKPMLGEFIRKLRLFQNAEVPLGMVVTVFKDHIGREEDLFHFCNNLFQTSPVMLKFKVNPLYASGNAALKGNEHLHISPEEYGQFLINLWNLVRDSPLKNFFVPFSEWLSGINMSCEFSGNCQTHFISIDGEGGVYNCGRFFDYGEVLGNITDNTLSEILINETRITMYEREGELRKEECGECSCWELCHGGCPYLSRLYNGTNKFKDPFCISYKMVFDNTDILGHTKL